MTLDSNIVKVPYSQKKNGTPEERAEARSTAKRDGRTLRANPLRATFAPISPAVTIVGKMHTAEKRDIGALSNLGPNIIKEWLNELRAGADSARIVANELDRTAEHLLTQVKGATTRSAVPAPEAHTERDVNEIHAQAFCDLEGDVCDLERMGQIAQDLIVQCVAREDGYSELELSSFAVMELAKMLRNFKDRYYKRWHGELVGAS